MPKSATTQSWPRTLNISKRELKHGMGGTYELEKAIGKLLKKAESHKELARALAILLSDHPRTAETWRIRIRGVLALHGLKWEGAIKKARKRT